MITEYALLIAILAIAVLIYYNVLGGALSAWFQRLVYVITSM